MRDVELPPELLAAMAVQGEGLVGLHLAAKRIVAGWIIGIQGRSYRTRRQRITFRGVRAFISTAGARR